MHSVTWRRAARRVAPALLGVLLLTACGDASPGTAATVGSERLTVEQVQERTAAFLDAYPEAKSSGVTAAQVSSVTVENFIRGAIVSATAADLGIEVTGAELDTFIEERGGFEEITRLTSGAGVPPFPELVRAEVRSAVLQSAIGAEAAGQGASGDDEIVALREALDATAAELGIEVNPRYGTWNGSTIDDADGSLSLPLEELEGVLLEDPATTPQG